MRTRCKNQWKLPKVELTCDIRVVYSGQRFCAVSCGNFERHVASVASAQHGRVVEKIFFQPIGETWRPERIVKERVQKISAVAHKVFRKLETRENNNNNRGVAKNLLKRGKPGSLGDRFPQRGPGAEYGNPREHQWGP